MILSASYLMAMPSIPPFLPTEPTFSYNSCKFHILLVSTDVEGTWDLVLASGTHESQGEEHLLYNLKKKLLGICFHYICYCET
jgi:hypothetical protein